MHNHATQKFMKKAMKILLAVDGSEYSLAAVEEAARTPWPAGSVVRITSVAETPLPAPLLMAPISSGTYVELERILEERAVAQITQAMARFGEIAGAQIEATAKTLKGDPKAAILDEAEHWKPNLIIVGTHGYNAFERLWLGSVSRSVLSRARCSVEIVRRPPAEIPIKGAKKILLAVDGSECSAAAVEEIANRPWPAGSEVHVISVIQLPFVPTTETWALSESEYTRLERVEREQGERVVDGAISRLRQSNTEREIPLTLTSEVLLGHPEETIIETAKTWNTDLVVLGSHGYRGFKRFLLGSVSQAVVSHAPCSVEIVRNPAQET